MTQPDQLAPSEWISLSCQGNLLATSLKSKRIGCNVPLCQTQLQWDKRASAWQFFILMPSASPALCQTQMAQFNMICAVTPSPSRTNKLMEMVMQMSWMSEDSPHSSKSAKQVCVIFCCPCNEYKTYWLYVTLKYCRQWKQHTNLHACSPIVDDSTKFHCSGSSGCKSKMYDLLILLLASE